MRFQRIAYTSHARARMKSRRFTHAEVKRVINEPDVTHPSQDEPERMVAKGVADDGRRMGVVYTEEHHWDADVLIITVLDCGTEQ